MSTDRKTATLLEAETMEVRRKLDLKQERVRSIAFGPDNRMVAIGRADDVLLWDIVSNKEITRMVGQYGEIITVAISPDSEKLASGSFNSESLWLREIKTGKRIELEHPPWLDANSTDHPDYVAFSSDGTILAANVDERVGLWDVQSGKLKATLDHGLHVMALTSDGDLSFLVESDSVIEIRFLSNKKLTCLAGCYAVLLASSVLMHRHGRIKALRSPSETDRLLCSID